MCAGACVHLRVCVRACMCQCASPAGHITCSTRTCVCVRSVGEAGQVLAEALQATTAGRPGPAYVDLPTNMLLARAPPSMLQQPSLGGTTTGKGRSSARGPCVLCRASACRPACPCAPGAGAAQKRSLASEPLCVCPQAFARQPCVCTTCS